MDASGTGDVSEQAILKEGAVHVLDVVGEPFAGAVVLAFGQAIVGVGCIFVAYVTTKATTWN